MDMGIIVFLIWLGLIFYPAEPTPPPYDTRPSSFTSCKPCEVDQEQIKRIEKAHKKYMRLAEKKYGTRIKHRKDNSGNHR